MYLFNPAHPSGDTPSGFALSTHRGFFETAGTLGWLPPALLLAARPRDDVPTPGSDPHAAAFDACGLHRVDRRFAPGRLARYWPGNPVMNDFELGGRRNTEPYFSLRSLLIPSASGVYTDPYEGRWSYQDPNGVWGLTLRAEALLNLDLSPHEPDYGWDPEFPPVDFHIVLPDTTAGTWRIVYQLQTLTAAGALQVDDNASPELPRDATAAQVRDALIAMGAPFSPYFESGEAFVVRTDTSPMTYAVHFSYDAYFSSFGYISTEATVQPALAGFVRSRLEVDFSGLTTVSSGDVPRWFPHTFLRWGTLLLNQPCLYYRSPLYYPWYTVVDTQLVPHGGTTTTHDDLLQNFTPNIVTGGIRAGLVTSEGLVSPRDFLAQVTLVRMPPLLIFNPEQLDLEEDEIGVSADQDINPYYRSALDDTHPDFLLFFNEFAELLDDPDVDAAPWAERARIYDQLLEDVTGDAGLPKLAPQFAAELAYLQSLAPWEDVRREDYDADETHPWFRRNALFYKLLLARGQQDFADSLNHFPLTITLQPYLP